MIDAGKIGYLTFPGFLESKLPYRPSNRRLSTKLVPTLADRGCRVVNLGFLDRSLYFLEIDPQLSSRG